VIVDGLVRGEEMEFLKKEEEKRGQSLFRCFLFFSFLFSSHSHFFLSSSRFPLPSSLFSPPRIFSLAILFSSSSSLLFFLYLLRLMSVLEIVSQRLVDQLEVGRVSANFLERKVSQTLSLSFWFYSLLLSLSSSLLLSLPPLLFVFTFKS
jgi:hypothetical protein